jgi:heterodisulfide reductase subunit B
MIPGISNQSIGIELKSFLTGPAGFILTISQAISPAVLPAARNPIIADKAAKDLLVPCAACFQRLKAAEKALKSGKTVEGIPEKFIGNFNILHPADFIWEQFGEKALSSKVKKSLADLNPVCYYGCLITRPPNN